MKSIFIFVLMIIIAFAGKKKNSVLGVFGAVVLMPYSAAYRAINKLVLVRFLSV